MSTHYIYLIHPVRFLQIREPTYKIGKTTTNIGKYIATTYKDCEVIITKKVRNCHKLEHKIIKLFNKNFIKKSLLGNEYYTGDVEKMVSLIDYLIHIMDLSYACIKQKPMIQKRLDLVQMRIDKLKEEPVLEQPANLKINESDFTFEKLSGNRNNSFLQFGGILRKYYSIKDVERIMTLVNNGFIDKALPSKEIKRQRIGYRRSNEKD